MYETVGRNPLRFFDHPISEKPLLVHVGSVNAARQRNAFPALIKGDPPKVREFPLEGASEVQEVCREHIHVVHADRRQETTVVVTSFLVHALPRVVFKIESVIRGVLTSEGFIGSRDHAKPAGGFEASQLYGRGRDICDRGPHIRASLGPHGNRDISNSDPLVDTRNSWQGPYGLSMRASETGPPRGWDPSPRRWRKRASLRPRERSIGETLISVGTSPRSGEMRTLVVYEDMYPRVNLRWGILSIFYCL